MDLEETEPKKSFRRLFDSPAAEKMREAMQEARENYDREAEEFWENLSYDDKLKAFYYVTKNIFKGDVEDRGSYRWVLYDVFGFDMDAYLVGMDSQYMTLHNLLYEGVEFEKMKSVDSVELETPDNSFKLEVPEGHILSFEQVEDSEDGSKLVIKAMAPLWSKSE